MTGSGGTGTGAKVKREQDGESGSGWAVFTGHTRGVGRAGYIALACTSHASYYYQQINCGVKPLEVYDHQSERVEEGQSGDELGKTSTPFASTTP